MKAKTGKIDTSKMRILPAKHEYDTAKYFADRGYDIEFIPPNNSPNVHTPDFLMGGVAWEVKSPTGKSRRTIEKNFRKAMLQSDSIIFDLRRCNISDDKCIAELEHRCEQKKNVKRMQVIKRDGTLLKYAR